VALLGLLVIGGGTGTWAAYTAATSNSGNSEGAGSVTLTDNDSGTAMLSLSNAQGGAGDTSCIKVSYSGSLPSAVRLYGTTTGTGLDPYVSLTITRGSYSPSEPAFDSCTNFVPDGTTYITGQGSGVVYAGTLQDFPDSYDAGLGDPPSTDPETWTTGESHVYKIQLAVGDKDAAAGKNATQSFTWEAQNESHYTSTVLSTSGLVSYWRLGESSGTTALDQQGSNDGTYTGGVTLGAAGALAGDADKAASFDGTNDFVELPTVASSVNYTMEGWTYLTNSADVNNALYASASTSRILVRPSSVYAGVTLGGTEYFLTPSLGLNANLNTWVHWAAVRSGSSLTVYRNGVSVASRSDLPAATAATLNGRIGAENGSYYFLTGRIDEVAVYNTSLSASQVKAHYDAGTGS
jgi:hypothetical protein